MANQQFVYREDVQGYWHNHVLMVMAQEGDAPIDAKQLEKLSWEPLEAGRFSTAAGTMVEIAKKHGLNLSVVERREKLKSVPSEWAHLLLVCGATGNY